MRITFAPSQKYSILLFLIVWFWVWGICPWNSSAPVAQAMEAAQAQHGHQEMDDTHHASKGTEHSCSGSIFYGFKSRNDRPQDHVSIQPVFLLADPVVPIVEIEYFLTPLLQRRTLPKLLAKYYQLYSVYRI